MKLCALALLVVTTCRAEELEQYTPDKADWTTFYEKAVTNNNGNTDHSPDGIGWISRDDWVEWDGTLYDPSEYSRSEFAKLICTGSTVRGLREVFYNHNPFSDIENPTKAEVDNWHAIAVNHVRAMVNYTGEEYTIKPDKCLHIRALWSDERFFTDMWDEDYPDGTCAGTTNPHCGASFVPNVEDQQPYLPDGIDRCVKYAGSEGMFNAAKSNIPWSIKWARPFCATLGGEGFWGGHTGPWFHRPRFGWSWYDSDPDNGNSNAGLRTKWGGSSAAVKYVDPDVTDGKWKVLVEGVDPNPRFTTMECEDIIWTQGAVGNATDCYNRMIENEEYGKTFMTYNGGCGLYPKEMTTCVAVYRAGRLTWDFRPVLSSFEGFYIDINLPKSSSKFPYTGKECGGIQWKMNAGDASQCLQRIIENYDDKFGDCGRKFMTWNSANGGCACYLVGNDICNTIRRSGRHTYEIEVDPTYEQPTDSPSQSPSETISPSQDPTDTISPSASPSTGEPSATLTVEKKRFTEPVDVEFSTDDATNQDWIGIFTYIKEENLEEVPSGSSQFWTYTCGTQTWIEDTCEAVPNGKVTFDGVDPDEGSADQWPINPGKYTVCHMREDMAGATLLIQPCKVLTIQLSNKWEKKAQKKASVKALKTEYKVDEKIKVKFDAKLKIPNGYVGIYRADDDKEMLWVYTGCNNVKGDQEGPGEIDEEKSNDCIKTKKKGKVSFSKKNTGRSGIDWPLPVGEYYLRLQYYNNSPQDLFKESKDNFFVV